MKKTNTNNKTSHYEAIRRGFNILSIVTEARRTPLATKDFHSRINNLGTQVSKKTIERDLKALTEQFPEMIEVDDSSKPYTYRQPKLARKYSAMSPEEAVCLQLAFAYLNPLLPNRSLEEIRPYLKEAEAVLNEQSSTKMRNWKNKVLTINEGLQLKQAQIKKNIIENMHKALWDGKAIIASYQSKKKAFPSDYLLHPAGLVYRGRICYLVCSFDDDPEKIIYLAAHRFHKIEISLDTYSRHKNQKIQDLASDLFGYKLNEKKINIKLKFSIDAGSHLYETPISDSQRIKMSRDGCILVEDKVSDNMELRFWIRAFGDSVEVLKPLKLRKEFKEIAKSMSKTYQKD
tara:strand:- start:2900 stop:3937 length:1038 start_codon:yes stop_codon:yes gene_type:complete